MNTHVDSSNQKEKSPEIDNFVSMAALLDSLRAIAQEGLSYSKNEYDTARYEKLLNLASTQYASITGLSQEEVKTIFLNEQGSITPKIGVDAAVVNDEGAILVLKRGDGTWGMPGGWADVGESPFESGQRETLEETGLDVTPVGYIGITHKTPVTHPTFVSQVNICIALEPVTSNVKVQLSNEHSDFKWIHSADKINDWHPGQERLFPRILDAYKNQSFIPDIE